MCFLFRDLDAHIVRQILQMSTRAFMSLDGAPSVLSLMGHLCKLIILCCLLISSLHKNHHALPVTILIYVIIYFFFLERMLSPEFAFIHSI